MQSTIKHIHVYEFVSRAYTRHVHMKRVTCPLYRNTSVEVVSGLVSVGKGKKRAPGITTKFLATWLGLSKQIRAAVSLCLVRKGRGRPDEKKGFSFECVWRVKHLRLATRYQNHRHSIEQPNIPIGSEKCSVLLHPQAKSCMYT